MISVHFQGKPFSITVIQVYVPTTDTEEAEFEQFYDDLQDLLELRPKKDGAGEGSLACCSPWGHKDTDMTERLN